VFGCDECRYERGGVKDPKAQTVVDVLASGWIAYPGGRARCALGRGGVVAADAKREGDGATPAGLWPLRAAWFRPDRLAPPASALPVHPIDPMLGWCDDPLSDDYNRPVRLPHTASHERMWREDAVYDLVVVLGYNDDPPVAGCGSAIFLHLARPDFAPTEGCVATDLKTLLAIIRGARSGDHLEIHV
jgi:L,D-peptidoglycan transpeptidase YkuD (ErfK/YbiS/YcfS/YnhG family)